MTQTMHASNSLAKTGPSQFYRRCLIASVTISSMGVFASLIGWSFVRLRNLKAVESGGRIHDLVIASADGSSLPLVLFIMFIVGGTALGLALLSAKDARLERRWLLVVAGMLATTLVMVPVVVIANAWVVTTGVSND